jgi:hypothetical protein
MNHHTLRPVELAAAIVVATVVLLGALAPAWVGASTHARSAGIECGHASVSRLA